MPKICNFFSKTNFWIENILYIAGFIMFEVFLSPFVFLKSIYTIVYSTNGMFTTAFNIFKWVVFGILYLFFILCTDVVILLDILRMHDGCRAYKDQFDIDQDDDEINDDRKLELFNEVREVVITHYLKERYTLLGGSENKNLSDRDLEPANFSDILALLEEDEKRP